ncbi:MAG: transcription termination factor NusA [Aquificaceae bacterium]
MVKNLRRLIEQVAKEKNLPEWIVERSLKNAIALAIKKDRRIKTASLEIELGDDSIKVTTRNGEPLDISPEDINRIAAYAAREEFLKELEKAEEERGFLEFLQLENKLVVGIVRKITPEGDALVDLGKVSAILPKREQIKRESLKQGSGIKALLLSIKKQRGKHEITLSRTHPQFLKRLIEQEVPEVASGEVQIKALAREPGERAKLAVLSKDGKLDPVGAVLGLRGSRINTISEELCGERIDVFSWSDEPEELIRKSLQPAQVLKLRLNSKERKAEIAVDRNKLSLAIGKGGVNVKLANKITGWHLDIMSLEDFEKLVKLK